MRSIRIQITLITIVAILTSILLVFSASYRILQNETDQNSAGMMNLITMDACKSLEKYFESIEQSVEIAANIAVENMDIVFLMECGAIESEPGNPVRTPEQTAALDDYLASYCEKLKDFFSGVAGYTHGVSAYFFCINPEISRNEQGFFFTKIGKNGFFEQDALDVLKLDPVEPLQDDWYATAVAKGRPVWIGPYRSDQLQDLWICSYFVPIYKAGMLIGLMGMDIPCDTLVAQIEPIQVYDTGYVCLLDAEHRVIYHPELSINGSLDALDIDLDPETLLNDFSSDDLIRYSVRGEERQMSFFTLANGMKLVSIAPADEINAPWIRLIQAILMISVVVILFYVVLILFLMKIITKPLRELTDASKRLADGDYNVDLTYKHSNEIGTLTSAFKQMSDRIRQYIGDLSHQLYHDRMTDLPNMRYFFSLAEEENRRLTAEGKTACILYFDIIGLRYFNRQYGFYKGDTFIVKFAGILRTQFGDLGSCRFNGGHFTAVAQEDLVEDKLRRVLEECETIREGTSLPVRIGVYPLRLEKVDINIACDRAKIACDHNKGGLSSSITYFDEDMLKKGEIYRHIINSLDQALAEGWIRVYYQPIIRAVNGKVCDEEALARWIDPSLGFLAPGDFISALEESRLIYKLDLYMVDQVLEKMKKLKEAGLRVVPQSINLSRMDFESCDVVEEICSRLDAAGIDHDMMTIEITESVIGRDFDYMKEQVERFRRLGFSVWMDDFGSGYSSLDVLQQIHFDLIKFDMRFMERFGEGDESRIILTELMKMAEGLGMKTVCEGVEQPEQVEFLKKIGCTMIQGYYYGKPRPCEGAGAPRGNESELIYESAEEDS